MTAQPLRLLLRCVGGFTGPAGAQTRSVDVDRMPAGEAAQLRALVGELGIARQPPALLKARPQPWDFTYTLTVDDGGVHTLRFHLDAAPPCLRRLVEMLEQH